MGGTMTNTILLLSGGVDSTALAYSLRPDLAITVDYGQSCAEAEVRASTQICDELDVSHETIKVDCSDLGTGQLAQSEQLSVADTPEWWPFRNQLIITLAAMDAIRRDANELIVGSVIGDREHADGQPKFYKILDELITYQEGDLSVSAPAIDQTSEELVSGSGVPLSILGWTHSCHQSNWACGQCRGCVKRERVLDHIQD